MLNETDDATSEAPDTATDENPRGAAKEVTHAEAMKQWNRAWLFEQDNIDRALEDLEMLSGIQWDEKIRLQRIADSRPVLTFNRLGQFIRQVTGDLRKLDPDIKTVPVDDGADEKIAEIRGGMRRYIENRCDAHDFIYPAGADSQVAAGIGHWEVFSEYADDSTFMQELGVRLIDDQTSVLWDMDAKHPTRKDAMWCFVPIDLSREAYKETYPEYAVSDLGTNALNADWFRNNMIRIARYWYKVKTKRRLMKMPNGGFEDLSNAEASDIARMKAEGGKIVTKDGHKIRWVMMNGVEFISEPEDWPGRFIPVVPLIGEEIRIGGRIVRHGIVRFAADPQRAYNYARSTQTEFVGLQPKAPFIGTEENFKDYENEWNTANVKNWPFLRYKPDPRNGNAAPQRSMPPQSSSGLTECIMMAEQDMQAVIGIYNASLGARSNETSGIAIKQREQQGDTGTYVYVKNYGLSRKHTARIIDDLIPHFYDTARIVRVIGIDNSERREPINQPGGLMIDGVPADMVNDLSAGAYDVSMELGPSYHTKREEARQGMTDFMTAFPPAAPILAPVMADLQDWPNKDLVTKLLTTLAPPPVQAILAQSRNQPPPQPPPPPPPNPVEEAKAQGEIARAQGIAAKAQFDLEDQKLKLRQQELINIKAEFDVLEAQLKLGATGPPLDSGKLHAWIGQVDMALQALDRHAAGQIAGLTGAGPVGGGGPPQGPSGALPGPQGPPDEGQVGQAPPGGEAPPPLPPGLPEGGGR